MHSSRSALRCTCFLSMACLALPTVMTRASATSGCEGLLRLRLVNARITSATNVAAGEFPAPAGTSAATSKFYATLPSFCHVTATLTPSNDSNITMEVWLPQKNWNGRLEAVGNGGWAGAIPLSSLASVLLSGFAAAGTDSGHIGNNAEFALGHPEKLIDFGYRSIHETAIQSKVIINAYYRTPARFAYFNGCSQGGRQGLSEAQRYPQDFNGIIAGASAINQMSMHAARTALNLEVNKDKESVIPKAKYEMMHHAVIEACDGLDEVKDGVIENPVSCKFDYSMLLCKHADNPGCLTKGQVESAKAMTSPLKDSKTGGVLFAGHLMPGSELGWGTIGGTQPLSLALSGMQNVVFRDRKWDYHTLNLSTDLERASTSDGGVTMTTDSNLKPFFDRGGKLLLYHGWWDAQVNPLNSINYYQDVVKAVGQRAAADSIALFMVPGMNHCAGGPGADMFDKLKVIKDWVENGKTPTRIIASHSTNGKVDKTRPLCPYGQTAKYNGTGDFNDAANFTCREVSSAQPSGRLNPHHPQ